MSRNKMPLLSRRRCSAVTAVLIITIFLLFASQRLSYDGYSSAGQTGSNPSLQWKDDRPVADGGISTRKAAVIVENRRLDNLIPIILHFSSVLGSEWPIHIFTSERNTGIFQASVPFQRNVAAGRFHVRALPPEASLTTHASVSSFFTGPWLWEQMAPAEHLLLFQADSILCSNSQLKVEDFLQYDFVGAPVDSARGLGMGYNGGLSIRNRSLLLEITQSNDWQVERHGDHSQGNVDYEDQWFSKKLRELPPKPDGSPGANLPSPETAMRFSVETMWFDRPLGYHQPNVWQADHMSEIYRWCPEYRLCTLETFTDHNPESIEG